MELHQTQVQLAHLRDGEPGSVASPPLPISPDTLAVAASGEVYDIHGSLWHLHRRRPTKHGFDLLLGRQTPTGGAPPSVILTPELAAYCETNRIDRRAAYDLPASIPTIELLRRRLGINYTQDRLSLWRSRAADLESMTLPEIARRFRVSPPTAANWRARIVGPSLKIKRVRRRPGWWQRPAVLEILLSNNTLNAIGKKLKVSATHVGRLRLRASLPTSVPRPRIVRPANWWRDLAVLEILLSEATLQAKSETLGISPSHTHRLWLRALADKETELSI
jgi:hypothetical protein